MSVSEKQIEEKIQQEGLTAPRLTPELISRKIQKEQYYVFPGTVITVCCLTLDNGFCVIGKSACASSANFNKQLGEEIAKTDARNKIWDLEGYLLKEKMQTGKA